MYIISIIILTYDLYKNNRYYYLEKDNIIMECNFNIIINFLIRNKYNIIKYYE